MIYIMLFLFLGLCLSACIHLRRLETPQYRRRTRKDRHYE